MKPLHAVSLTACLLASCSGGGGSDPSSSRLDPNGGTLEIRSGALAGTQLRIPAGALTEEVELALRARPLRAGPEGTAILSPTLEIGPAATSFDQRAELTMPFSMDNAPSGAADADFHVLLWRTEGGQPEVLDLTGFSRDGLSATVAIDGTGWAAVAVDVKPDRLFADYFPLNDGNEYDFDSGVKLTVTSSTSEPNLEGRRVFLFAFDDGVSVRGFYLLPTSVGTTLIYGRYDTGQDYQEIVSQPSQLLPISFEPPNQLFRSFMPYALYRPYAAPKPSFWDESDLAIRVSEVGDVSVPLGDFSNVIKVELTNDRNQGVTSEIITMWLAPEVGVIQYQFGRFATPASITSGWVNGQRISPR